MTVENDITTEIDVVIDAMTVAWGFNFDYDNINEYRSSSKTYPNVKSDYKDIEYEDPEDQMVDSYSADLEAIFVVTVDDSANVDVNLRKVLEDFQRQFESKHDTLQAKGWIVSDLESRKIEYTNIRKRPGIITMTWNIKFRVKRSDPAVTI